MVEGLLKFPDAAATWLFGKMAAEEMIPRRLEGGGGGDFVLSLIIPHALVLMLVMMTQNTIGFQTKR